MNCRPFRHGRWLFVHNGLIRGFQTMRRDLLLEVDPSLFPGIAGSTDSELLFHLALTFGLEADPLGAMERAVAYVESKGGEHGVENPVQMTVGITDGENVWAIRYSSEHSSRTLFDRRTLTLFASSTRTTSASNGLARATVWSSRSRSPTWRGMARGSGVHGRRRRGRGRGAKSRFSRVDAVSSSIADRHVGRMPHLPVNVWPGSRRTRSVPLRKALGGHVMGSVREGRRSRRVAGRR